MADHLVANMQNKALRDAVERLGRPLTTQEQHFVRRHHGLLALEAILDTIANSSPEELTQFLNSK